MGTLVFEVEDIDSAFRLLDERGGTMITGHPAISRTDKGGTLAMFSITTPLGDSTFRFFERKGLRPEFFPGFVAHTQPMGGTNRFGFHHFDHVTSNFQTMKPALLWMEHVFGMEKFWDVEFHTTDVHGRTPQRAPGSRRS